MRKTAAMNQDRWGHNGYIESRTHRQVRDDGQRQQQYAHKVSLIGCAKIIMCIYAMFCEEMMCA